MHVHNSILITDYLTKTVPQPPYSTDLAPCNFWLFPKLKEKLRGCRYKTIEEMKEAVTKVIDTLTQEEFHGTFQKLLERYNKCIAAKGDYFEGDKSFMCVLSIKVPIRKKKVWKLIVCSLYMDVYVLVFVCVHGWMAKEGIISPVSLKRRKSVQKTFLCLLWCEDHTKSCARENLQDRKRRRRTLISPGQRVSQLGVRPRSGQSGTEKQSV